MLRITIPKAEFFNEGTQEFIQIPETTLTLEHSLVSISKWESKWKKPFLGTKNKTTAECQDYVRCMTLTQHVDPVVYLGVTPKLFDLIDRYTEDSMTATTFKNEKTGGRGREMMTAEVIYYWMITLNIPFECQKWHLNRLLTLIRVCNVKNGPRKKMSRKEAMRQHAALNAARRSQTSSRG